MDRALKERIIGATVLVIFTVLIVPVFLDGPSTDTGMTRKLVALPGQGDQVTRQQTIVLTRDRSKPEPQATTAKVQAAPLPKVVKQQPALTASTAGATAKLPASQPQPTVKPSSASATGMWVVQMGSFSSKANAERLASDLRKKGFAAFLSQHETSSGEFHRVRIGPQKDRRSAESIAAQLDRADYKGQVVPHP